MYPRRLILQNGSYSHVFFRCHNRQEFLKRREVKNFLIKLWAKYKSKYQIQIFEFVIMDNHAHLLVYVDSVNLLGDFMRTVNSQLSRYINTLENRDSQAIRERYKSPVITNQRYIIQTMQYIWLNRFKIDKKNPSYDPYCSVSWRLGLPTIRYITLNEEEQKLLSMLLDSYPETWFKKTGIRKFIRDLLNEALSKVSALLDKIFLNGHTIGDNFDVEFRGVQLASFKRESPLLLSSC